MPSLGANTNFARDMQNFLRVKMGIDEIEVTEDKTIKQLVDELGLSSTPVLLELGGEVFYPDEKCDKRLKRGDVIAVIRIVAGG